MNARPATVGERCASHRIISNIAFVQSLILPYVQDAYNTNTNINDSSNPENGFGPCPTFFDLQGHRAEAH